MGYSSLATYKQFTSHKSSGRGGNKPVYIAIHHMAGRLTVQQCGAVFRNNEVSAHYGIQGRNIGVYVDENDTAWALGNFKRNQQSINIELSNSSGSPNWYVADDTIQTCIDLVADIAYRLGWTYISYTGDMNGDIIAHRWVAATACPGNYLYSRLAYIASEADKKLKIMRANKGKTAQAVSAGASKVTSAASKLAVDGLFGTKSCIALQKWLGSPYRDGILSGQLSTQARYILNFGYCVKYGKGGSATVKLLQKKLGVTADGYLGVNTVRALQRYLNKFGYGLVVDGYAGANTCKAFQKYLNTVV